ncbi:hypothetical protein B0H13DRAFT_2280146 [Mycena leptocephala]|nr:hypothetical protein B0H13DRAFT_2280146 [Mycena leptocephala]
MQRALFRSQLCQRKAPRTISYALTVPALIANLVIIITMAYLMSPAFEQGTKLDTDGDLFLGPLIALIITGIETLYLIIAIVLTVTNVAVPALAAILLDCLLLIPSYIVEIILVGILNDGWQWPIQNGCYPKPGSSVEDCRAAWRLIAGVNILAMVLQSFGLVLAVIDCVRVIRIHRSNKHAHAASSGPDSN